MIGPAESFTYEFDAAPFGCHLYHCHSTPLKRHIHKGLYGAFIIDPDPERHPEYEDVARSRLLGTKENERWQEFMIVMNGFDTNFDNDNEMCAADTVAFAYQHKPVEVQRDRPIKVCLVNTTEIDPGEIEAPTLLLWGADDEFQPIEYAERLGADISDAELVGLDEAHHWVVEDRPEAYREELRAFLEGA
jgi:pimeloyl-ACP methyl ester carboxylesterase